MGIEKPQKGLVATHREPSELDLDFLSCDTSGVSQGNFLSQGNLLVPKRGKLVSQVLVCVWCRFSLGVKLPRLWSQKTTREHNFYLTDGPSASDGNFGTHALLRNVGHLVVKSVLVHDLPT